MATSRWNVATEGDGETSSKTDVNLQIIPLNDKSDLFRAVVAVERLFDPTELRAMLAELPRGLGRNVATEGTRCACSRPSGN